MRFEYSVLHLAQNDAESGAGREAYRLHREMGRLGVISSLVVSRKRTDDPTVMLCARNCWGQMKTLFSELCEAFANRGSGRRHGWFSPTFFAACDVIRHAAYSRADVIILRWITGGMLRPESFRKISKPLIWVLSDAWPFTGGCHYPGDCIRYYARCGRCPALTSKREHDLSRWLWNRKKTAWQNAALTVVGPSRWIVECARKSSLFRGRRVELIPTGIDLDVYRPIPKQTARSLLGLPSDRILIGFGALGAVSDQRKGYAVLRKALTILSQEPQGHRYHFVLFGTSHLSESETIPFPFTCLGRLFDDISLALAYSALDVFVAPSLEENLANTCLESIACGTPLVAFDIGGMPDIIDHQLNGWLVPEVSPESLARGIEALAGDRQLLERRGRNARRKAESCFDIAEKAARYRSLISEVLERHGSVAVRNS